MQFVIYFLAANIFSMPALYLFILKNVFNNSNRVRENEIGRKEGTLYFLIFELSVIAITLFIILYFSFEKYPILA
ncbi:hypothetical protein [Enterococcus cecorum]|uniref:hypothetical protein n=1 Tax=Enterococcus cecorum TaxID=44008 RepID=UPI0022D69A57|nr:hypothetical protein [Enterococcus cecorum]CAI3253522.1 hypothetical protein CIRMBP1228_00044 [Enterococcus cecorum]CAI3254980.1 hypothetical protein CIRMBP1281_00060 [Enterococcus cecorum]CAI3308391.1 hypothetical protein CIRMBP1223_00776 [Enterococcus cecorum]CAI3311417.1 hypothetical protein CIRMBP1224_00762 [Enterococcus cecorum]CAI3312798.1 hypothetical protein CIRMBP1219_00791 [Enterococcus cecorum]